MTNDSLEQALTKEFLSKIKDRKLNINRLLTCGAFENEAEARGFVGYLRACGDLEEDFNHLLRAFFPTT